MKTSHYLVMLLALLAFSAAEYATTLTSLEVNPMRGVLIVLVLAQTAYFVLVSMHLKDETQMLRRVVALPLVLGALYGLVLITESAWRHL